MEHVKVEFEKYEENRRRLEATAGESDFDRVVKRITDEKPKKPHGRK